MNPSTGFLAVAYRDGRVHLGRKTYPAGTFAVHLLNQYHANEVGPRLAVFRSRNWEAVNQLRTGYLSERLFSEAGTEIGHILDALPGLQPFSALDLAAEQKRISNLFTEANGNRIREYFLQRTLLGNMDGPFSYPPSGYDAEFCHAAEGLLQEALAALDFYDRLGDDCRIAFEKLKTFVARIDEAERFDEEHLLPLALEVFGSVTFHAMTEYVPRKKSGRSNTATVARRMYFDSFYSFILTDFFEGLHHGHYPRRCNICNRFFLMTSARRQRYCTGYAPELYRNRRITCRNLAAVYGRKELAENDPITARYNHRCSAIRTELSRGKITKALADAAKGLARDHKLLAVQNMEYANGQYAKDMEREQLYADAEQRCCP